MLGTAFLMGIHSAINIQINKQIGGGVKGGLRVRVIIILTRGMGKWLTYGIPVRYRVVLVERRLRN